MVSTPFRWSAWALGLCLLALSACSSSQSPSAPDRSADPSVVALIGPDVLTLSEFEDRYAKSVGGLDEASDDSLGAYQDYLQRYVDFRLKVLGARAEGFDQDATLQTEVATYRNQLARPFLLEREVLDPIIRDMYERSQVSVDASHILLQVGADASPEDTLAAYNQLLALRDSVEAGADFGALATEFSEDPSAQRPSGPGSQGRLGYFSSGRMVAPFEAAAFNTPVDSLSDIVRTRFGYHLLKVHDRKPRDPGRDVAHIMVVPGAPTTPDSSSALALIDSLQQRLAAGDDFAMLASRYSVDRRSAPNGGNLGTLEPTNQAVPPSFLDAVYALEEEGDISGVVSTPVGFHLVKLVSINTLPTYDEAYQDLKARANQLPRTQAAQEAYARERMAARGFSVDTLAIRSVLGDLPADSVVALITRDTDVPAVDTTSVVALGDSTYALRDVLTFIRARNVTPGTSPLEQVISDTDAFLLERVIAYEAAALESRDDEFKALMDEFRDGLLLFKYMEERVWNAASRDTSALEAYYEARADTYQFPERVRVISLSSTSDSLMQAVRTRLVQNTPLPDSLYQTTDLRVDTTRIEGPTSSMYDRGLALQDGQATDVFQVRNRYTLIYRDGTEAPRQKTFDEARTDVISRYQEELEQELLDELREIYEVQTFPDRLQAAFSDQMMPEAVEPTSEATDQ